MALGNGTLLSLDSCHVGRCGGGGGPLRPMKSHPQSHRCTANGTGTRGVRLAQAAGEVRGHQRRCAQDAHVHTGTSARRLGHRTPFCPQAGSGTLEAARGAGTSGSSPSVSRRPAQIAGNHRYAPQWARGTASPLRPGRCCLTLLPSGAGLGGGRVHPQ